MTSIQGADLFGDMSVDAVFIDGLHTYDGVSQDIQAWKHKVRLGGSLIFNDYQDTVAFPGISEAVQEEAQKHGLEIRKIDRTNALLGGKSECVQGEWSGVEWTPK